MVIEVFIRGWHPVTLNLLINSHWAYAAKLKKADKRVIAAHFIGQPKATGKRRVDLHIIMKKGQRAADPDAYFKGLADSLTSCGMLIDDNRQGVEYSPVEYSRNPENWGTIIRLTDVD